MVPISSLAPGTLPLSEVKGASGLHDLRNLGGAVGPAVIVTLLSGREAPRCERLAEAVGWANAEALRRFDVMAAALSAPGSTAPRGPLRGWRGGVGERRQRCRSSTCSCRSPASSRPSR